MYLPNSIKVRFQALYGKMKDLNSFRDTLLLGTVDFDSYSRKIAGLGIGFGSRRSHIDIYALRAWDNEEENFYNERSVNQQSNTVLGLSTRFRLFKRLTFATNIGISALTQNVNTIGDTQSLYENNITGSLVDLNASSNVNLAGDISLGYRYKNIGLNLRSRYVQPHYQPLSVAYINTDLLDYTIGANLGLFKNKIFLNGRLGIQKNNLSQQDALTNQRFIYNLTATAKLSRSISSTLVYNNFSNQLQASSISINELYTYSVTNSSSSVSVNYQKSKEDGIIISGSAGRSNFTIVAQQTEEDNTYKSLYTRVDGGYNWASTGTMFKVGLGYNKYNRSEINTNTYSINGRFSKKLKDEKFNVGINTRYTIIDVIEYREGTNWINQFNLNYEMTEKSTLALYLGHVNRSSYIRPTFSEFRSSLSYRIRF